MRLSAEDLMHHPWFADMKTRMKIRPYKPRVTPSSLSPRLRQLERDSDSSDEMEMRVTTNEQPKVEEVEVEEVEVEEVEVEEVEPKKEEEVKEVKKEEEKPKEEEKEVKEVKKEEEKPKEEEKEVKEKEVKGEEEKETKEETTPTTHNSPLSSTNKPLMMMLITMLLALSRLGVLGTHGTIRTDGTVLRAEPVILLAIHGVLLPAVQTEIAPVEHAALKLAARTAACAVANVMTLHITFHAIPHLIAVVMRNGSVAHGTAPEGMVFFQILNVGTLPVRALFVA